MNPHSDGSDKEALRERIIGLGTHSHQKSYYPELKRRIADLERFKTLLNETEDAIFLISARTNTCIDVNFPATKLTGYPEEELLTTHIDLLLHPDYRDIFLNKREFLRDHAGNQALRSEIVILTAQGDTIPVEITIRSVILTDELYYVIVARDITERKKTEKELEQYRTHLEEMVAERNEELTVANQELITEVKQRIDAERYLEEERKRLDVTLRSIGDAVITVTLDGNITYLNDAAAKLLPVNSDCHDTIRISD